MGASPSRLEKALAAGSASGEGLGADDARYFGLENFGNTCYCNSVLQALLFCAPLRARLLEYAAEIEAGERRPKESLLTCLAELAAAIQASKKRTGIIAPRKFIHRLRNDNELFAGYMHQDAHEFINYLLNELAECLEKEEKARRGKVAGGGEGGGEGGQGGDSGGGDRDGNGEKADEAPKKPKTFIHELFEGVVSCETRCLQCERITSRDECFMDLSLEIERDSSLTHCLRSFSKTELMSGDDKFMCDACCCYQEAQRRLRVKVPPRVLCLHLKRFKFVESLGRMKKLAHRVVFPNSVRLPNSDEESEGAECAYRLFAVVVHIGTGPHHGHYVALVESAGKWLLFDDDAVEVVDEEQLQAYYGASDEGSARNSEHGYLLFYERAEEPADAPTSTAPVVSEPFGRARMQPNGGFGAGDGELRGGAGAAAVERGGATAGFADALTAGFSTVGLR